MRTIKFRGYNRKNNIWLYGFYLQNRGQHFVCPDEFAMGKSWEDYEIDPETLGQYTGVNDKQGRDIYEGDIVQFFKMRLKISWSDTTCSFILENDEMLLDLTEHNSRVCEIIGNIHDNPKLL